MTLSFKIPSIFGYILAGIIAGYNGFGLVYKTFIENTVLIEGILFMIVVSNATYYMFKEQLLKTFSRHFIIGAISSLITFILTLGFFAPLSIPLQIKIIMSLFSATFSPLMIYTFAENKEYMKPYAQISFGGYFLVVILWGIFMAFHGFSNPGKVKLAFMPSFIALYSIIAGLVWGYLSDKLFYHNRLGSFNTLVIMFLIYPFVNEFGLDFLFLAIGIGMYNGIFSEHKKSIIMQSTFSNIIIFGLFGMHLSLEGAFLLGKTNWSLVVILVSFLIFARIISARISLHFISHEPKQLPSIIYFIPCGPMALILIRRFLPGFKTSLSGEIDIFTIYSILTTSMMLVILIFLTLFVIIEVLNKKTIISKEILGN